MDLKTRTPIGTVYLIDRRPGKEMTATANTTEGLRAFKMANPHLQVVSRAEYKKFERELDERDAP